jgi:hypothetical protein
MNESCDAGNENEADDDSCPLVGAEDYNHMIQGNDDDEEKTLPFVARTRLVVRTLFVIV